MEHLEETALISALRRGDGGAIRAFIDRFHRLLLSYARRAMQIDPDAELLAEEVLADVIITLTTTDAVTPTHLAGYVLGAFRHRLLNARRARLRRERVERAAMESVDAEPAAPALPPVVRRLSVALTDELTADERRLLAWVSEHVPQRVIGEWLGVSHAAVRKRVERLRVRLRDASCRFERQLDPHDADELRRFFRRAGGASVAVDRTKEEMHE
jgi:RNA polymerase sigma factor (sigma-70 family)